MWFPRSLYFLFAIKIAHSVYISDIEIQALDSYLELITKFDTRFRTINTTTRNSKKEEARLLEIIKESCDIMSGLRLLDVNMINELLDIEKIQKFIQSYQNIINIIKKTIISSRK